MWRIKYMACDFNSPDCNEHRCFDELSFQEYIDSEEFQSKLKGKKLYGAVSHEARDKFISYKMENKHPSVGNQSDFLLSNGLAANVLVDASINDHKLYLTIETLPFGKGLELAALYDLDVDMQVSMSTELDIKNDKYYIVQIFGLDCTLAPAFGTELIRKEKVE